jgi:hypothetical protein
MLLASEGMHDGSLPDALHAVAGDDEAAARAPDQHLPALVTVPERPGAWCERHPVDPGARAVGE